MKRILLGIVGIMMILSLAGFMGCQKKEEMPKSQEPAATEQAQPKQTEQAPAQEPSKESTEKPAGQHE